MHECLRSWVYCLPFASFHNEFYLRTGIADVFLLDEPISGLSTSDAKLVMQTMQNMSRDKMVIATMHRPRTALLNQFHKVLVLDHGGQMAYWGDVPGMMRSFRKAAADMAIDVSEEARTAGGADYVFEVLEAPLSWHCLLYTSDPSPVL